LEAVIQHDYQFSKICKYFYFSVLLSIIKVLNENFYLPVSAFFRVAVPEIIIEALIA
jgi:hypothetical protein